MTFLLNLLIGGLIVAHIISAIFMWGFAIYNIRKNEMLEDASEYVWMYLLALFAVILSLVPIAGPILVAFAMMDSEARGWRLY